MADAKEAKGPARDAPLHQLSRDHLSVLLYFCFTDPELSELMKAQGVSIPGYRADKLSGVQKADAIADEIRAYPKAAAPVHALLKKLYEYPALDVVALTAEVANELAWLATQEDTGMRLLWRVLADEDEKVRAQAAPALDELVKRFYAPPGSGEGAPAAPPQPQRQAKSEAGDAAALEKLEREAKEGRLAAEQANKKSAELKAQLKQSRAAEAQLTKAEAKARKASEKLAADLARAKAGLAEARKKGGRAELDKAKKQLASLEAHAAALEEQRAKLALERDQLQAELDEAKKKGGGEAAKPAAAEGDEPDEAPREWLMPRFTPEFYDSLQGWDLRLQRAAFKQAYLLSENHRHPSLQALPLQGAPGFYRVRVATDVRLIYKRVDEKNVDILSLIDREDLDRYVRQAKTR